MIKHVQEPEDTICAAAISSFIIPNLPTRKLKGIQKKGSVYVKYIGYIYIVIYRT